jgi:hypothetical protein
VTCYPWFHEKYAAIHNEPWAKAIISSGCGVDGAGNVACPPDQLRAKAEAWLNQKAPQALAMIGGSLSQDVYTVARYVQSEVGSGTVEELVAVAEAAMNQAMRRAGLLGSWRSALKGMLYKTGYYGPIHAPESWCVANGYKCTTSNPKICCAPFGRWAATTSDPAVRAVLAAHLAVSGASGGFAGPVETQWGPEAWIRDGQARLHNFVKNIASASKYYWVGPIPGVDPWHTFLVTKELYGATSILGQARIALGMEALTLPRQPPGWPDDLSICGRSPLSHISPTGKTFLIASLGLAVGAGIASFASRRYLHPR